MVEQQQRHRTGVACQDCGKSLQALFYYNTKHGGIDKVDNVVYCCDCKKVYSVTLQVVG